METSVKIIDENVDLINFLAIDLLERLGAVEPSEDQIESMENILKRECLSESK